mmetsp:Transcript_13829/g.9785  ORF Transcript_13829/g.9785 Transcript_13829/m.9785 type:complete len:84 (+) Transcript_13829:219-470(+)
MLPAMVLFAKLIPENVETSMFALLTGLLNFSNFFAAKQLGSLINKLFFHVTDQNLEDLYKLIIVQTFAVLIPLTFVCLIPSRA